MPDIHWGGRDYQLVSLDQITLDEAIVVYEYTRLSLDQIPDLEGFHPGLIAALIHISVARAEPGETQTTIRKAVGSTPIADLEQIFAGISEEVDEQSIPPPDETSSDGSSSEPGDSSTLIGVSVQDSNGQTGTGSPGSATGATSGPATWGR